MPDCDERRPFLASILGNTSALQIQEFNFNWRIGECKKEHSKGKDIWENMKLPNYWPTTREKDPTLIHKGVTIYSFQMLQ